MYENKYKNPSPVNIKELESFLQILADSNEEIELYAIGGTAMTLKGIKESTKDIDFLTTKDYKTLSKILKQAGLKEISNIQICNIWYFNDRRIDFFYNGYIIGTGLENDWKEKSELIRTIGKIKLFLLNWYDLIITKLARSENRDIEDILAIIKKEKIDIKKLKERYFSTVEHSLIADAEYKFEHLERKLK